MTRVHICIISLLVWGVLSCTPKKEFELPVLGRKNIVEKDINGTKTYDTLDHTIAPFSFVNQEGEEVNNQYVKGKIYVADFFFTSCPTICPRMKKQMTRVYEKYDGDSLFTILSHTIDPEYDTIQVLKEYSEAIGVGTPTWHFLTGDREEIYNLGETSYMIVAGEDENEPGGYIHSGAFILVDHLGRIRGVYDGTAEDQVSILLMDIDLLLNKLRE